MITVFTPTYNRAYIIGELYHSLCKQSCKEFEWLVVDDGSTDNTAELIEQFQAEKKIDIRYIRKQNRGKHSAINLGVQEAQGELFFIVDSDDRLSPDTIKILNTLYSAIKDNNSFAGVAGVRVNKLNERIGGRFPASPIDCTALEIRNKYKIKGDLAEAYKTEVLKKYPFPTFEGERFVTEALIWNQIAVDGYKLRYTDCKIYQCEYLNDGLTVQMTRLRQNNPQATALYYSEYYKMPIPLAERIKTAINYWRFAPFNKVSLSEKIRKIGIKSMYAIPLGCIFYLKDKLTVK